LKEIESKLNKVQKSRSLLEGQIESLKKKKQDLEKHYRLLTSYGRSLECAVYEAFKFLGFKEISTKRSNDKEDWVFSFKNVSDFKYGVIEVKGANSRVDLNDLRQCDEWAWDYMEKNTVSKGIFIANQFRTESYPNSKDKRCDFDHNHVKFAKNHEICILPSCVLFEIVIQHLKSNNISREHIEKVIANTNGILKELPLS
jgi:hypothetical protein